MPKVSVVMPVYNSAKYLSDAIDSVLAQTFTDWEMLIINEFGSNDGSAEIVSEYSQKDKRIKLVQNDIRLGLGESLNKGFKLAVGEYIARLDADDLAHPTRFEQQVSLMDKMRNIGVCGTYQHHFGKDVDWVHKTPTTIDQCRSSFLFGCDICHSTLMIRRDIFIKNDLFYDNNFLAEDFELWTRAVRITDFVNIPEILGEYRIGEDNITHAKKVKLNIESGHIVANNLKRNLNLEIPEEKHIYFQGWENPFDDAENETKRKSMLDDFKDILIKIYEKNKEVKFYDSQSLLNSVAGKWRWAKYHEPWNNLTHVNELNEIFDENYKRSYSIRLKQFFRHNKSMKSKMKKICKFLIRPICRPFYNRIKVLLNNSEMNILNHIEWKTWDRYQRLIEVIDLKEKEIDNKLVKIDSLSKKYDEFNNKLTCIENNILEVIDNRVWKAEEIITGNIDGRIWKAELNLLSEFDDKINNIQDTLIEQIFNDNLIEYKYGEKIRIVFLFQIASFWPSWESFYRQCLNDDRFDVKLLFLDETVIEKAQMKTARSFLEKSKLDYMEMNDFNIETYRPHIMVYQTPYDKWHRTRSMWSESIKKLGIRIVYIPYGIEIADTDDAHYAHFNEDVIRNSWRIYTLSNAMKKEYKQHCKNIKAVKSIGIPKLDGLYHKDKFRVLEGIKEKANGKKIVLWKLHFQKQILVNGELQSVTPYIDEYIEFFNYIKDDEELFFIFMPHPRFCEDNGSETIQEKSISLFELAKTSENIYVDIDDDYRYSLLNADSIITDRSAIMVEASTVGVPVLYMSNKDYYEPITKAIEPLIKSYYQGNTCGDMIKFIEMIKKNEDPKKNERDMAFAKCIPYFDGQCGCRIKQDIISSLSEEIRIK